MTWHFWVFLALLGLWLLLPLVLGACTVSGEADDRADEILAKMQK